MKTEKEKPLKEMYSLHACQNRNGDRSQTNRQSRADQLNSIKNFGAH